MRNEHNFQEDNNAENHLHSLKLLQFSLVFAQVMETAREFSPQCGVNGQKAERLIFQLS